jgi:hypothetical protein
VPVRKPKCKSRMDHSHLMFQKLREKIRKTSKNVGHLYNNFFFPNRLVETSVTEWTDNIEYTRHRMKTNNTDT